MAVAPTGGIFKAFTLDGVSSRDYGVYITGEAVFNAPQRDVEMVTIPGRNGALTLDNGRFENIVVTYPAGIYADNEANFAEAISDFRNFLCSRKGYVRLTDDYNPDEFRMAVYKSGLEVSPTQLKAGEFEIEFECKPQRFLTSGEDSLLIASGRGMHNPTLFPSSPLLKAWGYGTITLGDAEVTIINKQIGEVQLSKRASVYNPLVIHLDNTEYLEQGDTLYVGNWIKQVLSRINWSSSYTLTSILPNAGSYYGEQSNTAVNIWVDPTKPGGLNIWDFSYGTARTRTASSMVSFFFEDSGGNEVIQAATISVTITYDGDDTISISGTVTVPSGGVLTATDVVVTFPEVYGDSTQLSGGNPPIYIDLEIGESWVLNNGVRVSVNDSVVLPAELPKLEPGGTIFTFPNTITRLEGAGRWWKI